MPPMESEAARKFHRVLRLLTLIQGGGKWNAPRLAAELGVDERTIYRYLEDLEVMGIPYFFDKAADGYRIRGDFFFPPIQFTPDEALALAVLCSEIGAKEQIAHLRPAWRALSKIQAQLPPGIRGDLERALPHIVVRTAASGPPDGWADVYERIRRAIVDRRVIRCVYEANNPAGPDNEEFDFEPYALYFSVRAWYAVGRHGGRGAVRTLKLNRFARCALTDRTFERPAGFSIDDHVGNAWRMIRGEPEYAVELRFDAEFTPTISDTLWHRTQTIEFDEDGSSTFRCTVAGLDEIVWWVLSMGPHCRVVAPAELRDRVHDLARATADLYH